MAVQFGILAMRRSLGSNAGAVAAEYALIGAVLGLGLLSALRGVKSNLNTNYDRISLQLQRVANDTSGTRKETSRDGQTSYTSNGQVIDQVWIRYDDGSSALLRTSPDPNSWFKSIFYDFGKDGVNHGATVIRSNGTSYTETYEQIRPNVVNVSYSEGSYSHSYLQEQIDLGNGYVGFRQTMNNTNISGDWSSGYVVNFYGNDASGKYVENNYGSRYTYPSGQVVNSGADISQYIR